ncbi:beta-1,6-N-acetylglucosaminyltransferase [Bifidobacterium gallicum]|nr:beta-1,6-N-acetylglucosaminyltransferase [Bifidobacterium gallicum]
MAHDRPEELSHLISSLDNSNHGIFVHLDASSDLEPEQFIPVAKLSRLVFVKRHKVVWGGTSQILAELELFSRAFLEGGFDYYHLLSGVDCVTHSNEYIDNYFSMNNGYNFITLSPVPPRLTLRYNQYHWLHESLVGKKRNIWKYLDFGLCYAQQLIGIKRFGDIDIPKHQTWCSLTKEFVACLVKDKDQIAQLFKYTYCCDEIFLTYELRKHGMWDTLAPQGSLRFIEWENKTHRDSSPRVLTIKDFDSVTNPDILFARKINFPLSKTLVKRIDEYRTREH